MHGISALTSVAETKASVVLANKQADEDKRHYQQIEQIAQGGNIDNDVIKKNNDLQINGKGISPLLVSSIISIIPELIKAVLEATNKIKQLIDGEGIKVYESKVLSDDKLIDQYTKFLRGKGFNVTV